MIRGGTSLEEVAFIVCTALGEAGVIAVLTGGSAATVHSCGGYSSFDVDFVLTRTGGVEGAGAEALRRLGYRSSGAPYHHPENPFTLDFPRGPLAVGGQLLTEWETRHHGSLHLHLLHPADSVKDRLAAFLHWGDVRGLSQAAAVWRGATQKIEREELRAWVVSEGAEDRWSLICAGLS